MAAKHSIEISARVPSDARGLPIPCRIAGAPGSRELRAERELRRLGLEALRAFELHSELITPGTPEALSELSPKDAQAIL